MPQRSVKLVLGGPGTGKTTHFIGNDSKKGVIGELLESGVKPSDIAYVSFTRKAADEAAERAANQFGLDHKDLPHFRTIHSMAYQRSGIQSGEVMQRRDYKEIAKMLGVTFTGYNDPSDGPAHREGDLILQWIGYAKAREVSLRDIWRRSGEAVQWQLVKLFDETINQYKRDMGKIDFADMLDIVVRERLQCPARIAIIDEAQDLSTAQWNVARTLFRPANDIYLAGDDDQAIHAWAGADVDQLLAIKAERLVLPVSHRLPREVFDLSTHIASRIRKRFDKVWEPAEHRGNVFHVAGVESIDLRNGESWLLLARNRCFTEDYIQLCEEQGVPYSTRDGPAIQPEHVRGIILWERLRAGKAVPAEDIEEMAALIPRWTFKSQVGSFTLQQLKEDYGMPADGIWHDALGRIPARKREFYMHCLRNGYRLQDKPPAYIGTIHSVKGGEADNVVLKTDMTYRTYQGLEQDPDNEHRVFYVGATRAKKNLYIVDQQEQQGYII